MTEINDLFTVNDYGEYVWVDSEATFDETSEWRPGAPPSDVSICLVLINKKLGVAKEFIGFIDEGPVRYWVVDSTRYSDSEITYWCPIPELPEAV